MTAITSPLGTLTGRVTSRIDRLSDRRFALLSFLPAGILIALIVIPPILAIFGMSLFRINLLRDSNTPFVGLTNYLRIGGDTDFLDSVPRTVIFAAGTTLLTVPLALSARAWSSTADSAGRRCSASPSCCRTPWPPL